MTRVQDKFFSKDPLRLRRWRRRLWVFHNLEHKHHGGGAGDEGKRDQRERHEHGGGEELGRATV